MDRVTATAISRLDQHYAAGYAWFCRQLKEDPLALYPIVDALTLDESKLRTARETLDRLNDDEIAQILAMASATLKGFVLRCGSD